MPAESPFTESGTCGNGTQVQRPFSFDSDLLEDKYESAGRQLPGNVEQALRALLAPHQLGFQKISKRYYTIFSNGKDEKAEKETSLNRISLPTWPG
jgi:hypothetical protein